MPGSPADLRALLTTGRVTAEDTDDRILVNQATATGVKRAAQGTLDGTPADLRDFLATG